MLLPDRVTVLTCIGCGAMGRQERCTACTEHKLVLVTAADDAAVHAVVERLAPVARELLAHDGDLRAAAREALHGAELEPAGTVTGWWCDRCGNVDMPQPCIGVCVWKPADWVNAELYGRRLAAARALLGLVTRIATVRPRPGQEERNRDALRAQARAALAALEPAPPPAAPPGSPLSLHTWPR